MLINKHELLKRLEEHFKEINDIAGVIECINECEEKDGNLTGGFTRIIVETDEENPTTIVTILDDDIVFSSDGYRTRMRPRYDN